MTSGAHTPVQSRPPPDACAQAILRRTMDRVMIGRHHATFPHGYSTGSAFFVTVFGLATLSRRVRAFFFDLPPSRLRTALVARYYHRLTEQMRDADWTFLRAVHPDAEMRLFFERYLGREGWKDAVSAWRETFAVAEMELIEFLNPQGRHVVLRLHGGGEAAASGLRIKEAAYIVLTVEHGMAVRGQVTADRAEALEAVGLSD